MFGIRQGCTLSLLTFVVSVKIMAIKYAKIRKIKGFKIWEDGKPCSVKRCQVSGDTHIFWKRWQWNKSVLLIFWESSWTWIETTQNVWGLETKNSKDKLENIDRMQEHIITCLSLGVFLGYNY